MAATTQAQSFNIERGIDVPPSAAGRPRIYPFPSMQPGDSFLVETGALDRVRGSAYAYACRHGVKLAVRKSGETWRCWRIA